MIQNPEEKVLQAALEVVAEKTISGMRMHLVAQRADMVQSNVHYYYKTKEELLRALQEKVLRHHLERRKTFQEAHADTLSQQLQALFAQKMEIILKDNPYDVAEIDFIIQGQVNPQLCKAAGDSFARWRLDIMRLIERHAPQLDMEHRLLVATIILSMMEGASLQFLAEGDCFDLPSYFAVCTQMLQTYLSSAE